MSAPQSNKAMMPPPPPPKTGAKRDWKILKDGQEWYFWDTVSNETSWNRPAEINDEMFEKMKSEYQAPADGKAMPSSPPQSPMKFCLGSTKFS